MATNLVQIENDSEIKQRLAAERARLRKIAGLDQPTHFHRPVERAFTAEERGQVTILFGGFTWKHEDLIRAVFQGCGYRCEKLPVPNVAAFQTGKEFGNNGQCNPTYFTVGNLVQYLQFLEKEGIPRQKILDNYVFFTAGSCGPCRFGMYEAEYRFALKNAGFDGFRVLLFKDSDGIKAASGEPGLKFTIDFGFGMLNAMHLGDVINDLIYQIRPYEVNQGQTDRVFREAVDGLCEDLKNRDSFEIEQRAPNWAKPKFKSNKILRNTANVFGKWHEHMWGKDYLNALKAARDKMDSIEVDRTRVKPLVKITGEFWAQITEGDGNFHMFDFLEREGAQVLVEPIATWVAYLMYQAKAHAIAQVAGESSAPQSRVVRGEKEFRQLHRPAQEAVGHRRRRAHVEFLLSPDDQESGRNHASPGPADRTGRPGAILSTTSSRAAAKDTSKSARTSTTPCTSCATWCWRSSRSAACRRRNPMACNRR